MKSLLTLIFALTLTLAAAAQSPNANDRAVPGNDARPSVPSADVLVLLGQVATAAEAKPLIAQYYAEQEQFFEERRAAMLSAKGRSPEEQLKAMQAVVAAQRDRRRQHRALEARISAMLKLDHEANLAGQKAAVTTGH